MVNWFLIYHDDSIEPLRTDANAVGDAECRAAGGMIPRREGQPERVIQVIFVFHPISLAWNGVEREGDGAIGLSNGGRGRQADEDVERAGRAQAGTSVVCSADSDAVSAGLNDQGCPGEQTARQINARAGRSRVESIGNRLRRRLGI